MELLLWIIPIIEEIKHSGVLLQLITGWGE